MSSETAFHADALLELGFLAGHHGLESNSDGPFVWCFGQFRLHTPAAKFLNLKFAYLAPTGSMTITRDGGLVDQIELRHGWQEVSLRLPATAGWIDIIVDPVPPVAEDTRELAVMLQTATFFDNEARHSLRRAAVANDILNDQEYRNGEVVLTSHPPNLRVNTETRCNIPETSQACTYCDWDQVKWEEKGSAPFRLETLDELGEFYQSATAVNDCSTGEPTMNRQFGDILLRFHRDGKPFSFTTNGQLLVEKRRRELLGKNVSVYVSLDSASKAGFQRYRNDRFDPIVRNLRALCHEKRSHGNLPRVHVSIIAMRSNMHELAAYFDLVKEIGVDEVKVRSLVISDNPPPAFKNNGFLFDYEAETLSMRELHELTPVIRQLADSRDVRVCMEWEEFERPEIHGEGEPLCAEPWKTLYVLNRGILPCAFGVRPLANRNQQGNRTLDEFLHDVFNSEEYQEIRAELAAGRMPRYCRESLGCPVLKRMAPGERGAEPSDLGQGARPSPLVK
jgi:MoaA/NifB/PqqE/SkfB family radical SAM enzyme